ncbi:MAG: D-aminoacyl-tRNA deacylase [bacterium]|nr:MAG: D-aminoacyl-tRNA deacylase [bacterium]
MRLVIQRVSECEIWIDKQLYSRIDGGLLVLLGVGSQDKPEVIDYMADKMMNLRILPDRGGLMNLSLLDTKGEVMIVSQFTLYGDCRKGRRPSYTDAMKPKEAESLYELFVERIRSYGLPIQTGKFQAMMDIKLTNTGPVTLLLDSDKAF